MTKPNIYIDAGNTTITSDTDNNLLTKIALVKACNNVDNVYVLANAVNTNGNTNGIKNKLNRESGNVTNASALYSDSPIQPTSVTGETHKIIFLKHDNNDVITKIVENKAIGSLDDALIVYYETEDRLLFLLDLFIAKKNRTPDKTPMADFYITAGDENAKAKTDTDTAKYDKLLAHIMHDSYSAKGVKVQMLMGKDYGKTGQLRTSTGGGFFTGTKSEMKMAELIMQDISRGKYKGTNAGTLDLNAIGNRLKKYYEGEYKKENKKTPVGAETPSIRFTKAALEMVIGMYRDTLAYDTKTNATNANKAKKATALTNFDGQLKSAVLSNYGFDKYRTKGVNTPTFHTAKTKSALRTKLNSIAKKPLSGRTTGNHTKGKFRGIDTNAFYIMHMDNVDEHKDKPNRIVYNNINGLNLLDNLLAKHITDVDPQTRVYYENNRGSLPGGKIHDTTRTAKSYKKRYNSRKAKDARTHRDKLHSKKQSSVKRTNSEKALNLMRPTDLERTKFNKLPIINTDTKKARAEGLLARLKGFKKPGFLNRLGGLTRKRAIKQAENALAKAKAEAEAEATTTTPP
jgi:hypothetical protein